MVSSVDLLELVRCPECKGKLNADITVQQYFGGFESCELKTFSESVKV